MKDSGFSKFVERIRWSFAFTSLWAILIVFLLSSSSAADDTTPQMIQRWKDKSNQGDAYAPFNLGHCYQKGEGVKRNLVEAIKWYNLGAERGDAQAALELAGIYFRGEGVQQDEEKAIEWYVMVAKSSGWCAPIARSNLLIMTMKYSIGGEGVKPNKAKAEALFKRLFEVEKSLMNRGQAEMHESVERFNEAADTLQNMRKDDFDKLKEQNK